MNGNKHLKKDYKVPLEKKKKRRKGKKEIREQEARRKMVKKKMSMWINLNKQSDEKLK